MHAADFAFSLPGKLLSNCFESLDRVIKLEYNKETIVALHMFLKKEEG